MQTLKGTMPATCGAAFVRVLLTAAVCGYNVAVFTAMRAAVDADDLSRLESRI
jgi:hypothetical protein